MRKIIVVSTLLLLFSLFSVSSAEQKLYIDINSPGAKKLPIAVQDFPGGSAIAGIIRNDLTFTGFFDNIPEAVQIEKPDQPFNPGNWKGLGAEIVVKGNVDSSKGMLVSISVHDVTEGRELFKKSFDSSPDLIRPLGHAISNEIYRALTGQPGIFRTKIAFICDREGGREVCEMDWDGFRVRGLGITAGIILAPRWALDGSQLLYSAERNRSWKIYILDMNTMKERNIISMPGLNMAGGFFPGNREFVFSASKDGKSNIYSADSSSMVGKKLISSPWLDLSPAVSPDGGSIVFVSSRSGNPQIYLADREGYGIKRITFEGNYNTQPAWSPKGDRIAFAGMVGGKNQIFVMNLDGTVINRLTDRGNNEEPSFSPDGNYIAFTSDRDGKKGVYIMRLNGEGQVKVSPKGARASGPAWAPLSR